MVCKGKYSGKTCIFIYLIFYVRSSCTSFGMKAKIGEKVYQTGGK